MSAARESTPGRGSGFTLIELLVAISLMAVLAVLSWRGLSSVLTTRERLDAMSDRTRELSVTFSQMEDDLRRSWEVRLTNPPIPPIGFLMDGNETWPAMQLLREMPPGSTAGQEQRVEYRLRNGEIERGFAPWVVGGGVQVVTTQPGATADATGNQSLSLMTWQPLLPHVAAIQFRAWIDGQGWLPAASLLTAQSAPPSATSLVTGVEVTIELADGERFVRIFPVKD